MQNQEYFYLIIEIEKIHYVFRLLDVKWGYEIQYLNISNEKNATEKGVFALVQLIHYKGEIQEEDDLIFPFNQALHIFLDAKIKRYTAEQIEQYYSIYLDETANSALAELDV